MSKPLNLCGQRFGRLLVVEFLRYAPNGKVYKVLCDCGNITECTTGRLRTGNTQSCGCLKRELVAAKNFVHGHAKRGDNAEYHAYLNARRRCTDQKDKRWKDYGGRGIQFRFKSLEEFIQCVGKKPSTEHVLDRIENSGHYESGNVHWTTVLESMRNKRHGGPWSRKQNDPTTKAVDSDYSGRSSTGKSCVASNGRQ